VWPQGCGNLALRSRIGEFIMPGVVARKLRLCDEAISGRTKDFRKPEGRYSSALVAAVRGATSLSAYMPLSLD
jgi:hypothetical protein